MSGEEFGSGGSLAYLLKNRFYICEVVYQGKIHRGEHEAIVDRALFEAVQAKLVNGAASRHLRLKASPAILAGRLHDDRGNRMTPTHANKHGVRYRYYVSHALLQKRRNEAGAVLRVSVPDIERVVIAALREIPDQEDGGPSLSERDLVERHVERIVVRKEAIEIQLSSASWRRWPLSRRGS